MENSSSEKIIVFDSYDTVMKANLVKTKLDAYGIPCFLTEENLTNLYPLQFGIFSGVRLHIFECDVDEVKSILNHQSSDTFIKCPHCSSVQLEKEYSEWQNITRSILRVVGLATPLAPQEYRCLDCGKQFGELA